MPSIPGPIKAGLGLAAAVVGEIKRVPDRIIEIPMLGVSTVLQMSLRAQQQYTALTVMGDEIIKRARGVSDDPPPWATFDDPLDDPTPITRLRSAVRQKPGPDAGLGILDSGASEG